MPAPSWIGQRPARRASQVACVTIALGAVVLTTRPADTACPDPFDFLAPSITITDKERQKLGTGEAFVRILDADGREIAVLGATAVDFDGDRLVAWMRQIEELKKSSHVPAVKRFSDPPSLTDLAAHSLEDRDLDALRSCRPGSCDLKLTTPEIEHMRQVIAGAGPDWKPVAQQAFRQLMLDRVLSYRAYGPAGIGMYADGHTEESLADVATALLDRSPYLENGAPRLVEYLKRYPHLPLARSESFFYWSKELFGGRPVTTATHVTILRPEGPGLPDALVLGRQVFATHYQNGSLSLTLLLRGCPGPPHYLAYINRSQVDVIRGLFGWLARRMIQGRVEDDAVSILDGLRERLSRPPGGSGPQGAREPVETYPSGF